MRTKASTTITTNTTCDFDHDHDHLNDVLIGLVLDSPPAQQSTENFFPPVTRDELNTDKSQLKRNKASDSSCIEAEMIKDTFEEAKAAHCFTTPLQRVADD